MRWLSTILLSAVLALPALGQTTSTPTLSATGHAAIEVMPDMATLTIAVENKADAAPAALEAHSVLVNDLRAKLTSAGLAEQDILAGDLFMAANRDGFETGNPRVVGFSVQSKLTAVLRNLDQLGAVYQAVLTGGARSADRVRYEHSNPAAFEAEVRSMALANARANAEALAQAAGMKLGRIVAISDRVTDNTALISPYVTIPETDQLTFSATVTVQFELVE